MVILLSLISLAFALLFFVLWRVRSRKLSSAVRRTLEEQWKRVEGTENPSLKILEAEKVLDQALSACEFQGSFGEKLKAAGPRFKNLHAVWDAHRLRNRIAHEAGFTVKEAEAERVVRVFRKVLEEL